VQLVCSYYTSDDDKGIDHNDDDIFAERQRSGQGFKAPDTTDKISHTFPCEVMGKMSKKCDKNEKKCGNAYAVRILEEDQKKVLLIDYPEESISFRMKRYRSDMHLPKSFRHYIEIDDSIFPEHWKTTQ